MARMGKDGYSSKGATQLSVKTPDELKDDFREACESEGRSMTEVVREKMEEYVRETGGSEIVAGDGPEDPRLSKAWRRLRENADPDTGKINTDVAKTKAAEAAGVSKGAVREAVLEPLRRRGWLRVSFGTIRVKRPSDESEPSDGGGA